MAKSAAQKRKAVATRKSQQTKKNAGKKQLEASKKKKASTASGSESDSSTESSSSDDEEPRPKKRRTTVRTEEEEDAEHAANGTEVIEIDLGSGDEGTDAPKDSLADEDEQPAETAEEELARLQATWDSPVYAFYQPEVKIGCRKGRRYHAFTCARKGCKVTGAGNAIKRYLDTGDAKSTGNLRKHARTCWGNEIFDAADEALNADEVRRSILPGHLRDGSITAHFARKKGKAVTYSHRQHTKSETRLKLVEWCAEDLRPFSAVADRALLSLLKTGRPGYYVPSPSTVSRDLKVVFKRVRSRIAKMLREYEGKLSFATDAWTSPNHRALVAVTVHLEHHGQPLTMLLDIVEVSTSHSGANLAAAFADILHEFGIEHKILSVTCDNASNNDTMVKDLSERLDNFEGSFSHTRCFLHILNLVAKAALKQFDVKSGGDPGEAADEDVRRLAELARELEGEESVTEEARRLEEGDEYEVDCEDDSVWTDELQSVDAEDRVVFEQDVLPVKMALVKIRKIAFKIVNSTTKLLPAWRATLKELKLEDRLLPRDVRTRWNSTFDMAVVAVKYRPAIDKLCAQRDGGLRAYELTAREWTILEQMRDVLKIFKDATLFFSRKTPNVAKVLHAMDHIDTMLTNQVRNESFDNAIRFALRLAKKVLNRYYNLSDLSAVYRLALLLHPSYKTEYFRQAGWPSAWGTAAEEMLYEEFARTYKTPDADDGEPEGGATAMAGSMGKDGDLAMNDFDHLPTPSSKTQQVLAEDELARYLAAPTEETTEPLQWWTERAALYPCLSRMARDYLSIPGTSVDVERVFSRGRRAVTYLRSRLSAQTTRALLCVGAWSRLNLLLPSDAKALGNLPVIENDDSDYEMEEGWDRIEQTLMAAT